MRLQVDKENYAIERQPIVDVLKLYYQDEPFEIVLLACNLKTIGPRNKHVDMLRLTK